MLTLKTANRVHAGLVCLDYDLSHSTPGPNGTTLKADLTMNVTESRASVTLAIDECDAPTPKEAIERMSRWLERLKEGLDKRKETWLPL